jgi:hypothetical protein
MNRSFFAVLPFVLLFGCGGGGGDAFVLKENQGGAFIIIEMPDLGASDNTISQLDVGVLDLNSNLLVNLKFNNNDLKGLPNGPWPTTRGTCVPLRATIEDPPDTFLPGNSSCLTFALVHDFSEEDQTDREILVTLDIKAKDGSNDIKAQLAHTVRLERGLFKGDPATAVVTADLTPSIATLQVLTGP